MSWVLELKDEREIISSITLRWRMERADLDSGCSVLDQDPQLDIPRTIHVRTYMNGDIMEMLQNIANSTNFEGM